MNSKVKEPSENVNATNVHVSYSSSQSNSSISNAELDYMLEGCNDDFRVDGRTCADIRPYAISGASNALSSSSSALILSNGSARIFLPGGATDIICSTKAEIARPALLNPNEGIIDVNVDYFSSSMNSTKRQKRLEETELSQIITRLVLPNALSLKSLCILPGKYCWKISIDVLVLADDGCVVDVASMAIYKALNNTILPVVKPIPKHTDAPNGAASGSIGGGNKPSAKDDFIIESGDVVDAITPDGALNCPIVLTVCILQQHSQYQRDKANRKHAVPAAMVIDARSEEELCAMTKVCVAVDRHGMICGVLKFGASHGAMSYRMLAEITDLAVIASKSVFGEILDQEMAGDGNEMADVPNSECASDFLHGHFNFQ